MPCSVIVADSRKEVKAAVSVDILPFDIIATNILPRLPVKPLGRFRCMCKQWCALTYDPRFAMEQLMKGGGKADADHEIAERRTFTKGFVRVMDGIPPFYSYIRQLNSSHGSNGPEDIVEDRCFPFKLRDGASHTLSNSVNGLVCVSCRTPEESVAYPFLFNPTTREVLPLPEIWDTREALMLAGIWAHLKISPCWHLDYILLGYDASSGLYKLVCTHTTSIFPFNTTFNVLTVGSGGWRCVGKVPCGARPQEAIFLNGSIYWPVTIGPSELPSIAILAFDVGDEKLRFISVPKKCADYSWRDYIALQKLEGHLCLVRNPICSTRSPFTQRYFLRIWKLEDYVDHRWKRIYDVDLTSFVDIDFNAYETRVIDVVCGELLIGRKHTLYSYDLRKKTLRVQVITDHLPQEPYLHNLIPSLVSPNNLCPVVGKEY